ncbi:MAG: DUF2269 domain-containing protein [Ketobacter sp.]|nr:MAG: DUF2269 domain-containing protein [Ketobacter sp.]
MSGYLLIKTLHIISATILFGTGIGIAFFMFRSHFTPDLQQKLYATSTTVLADKLFTLPAGLLQLGTGLWLVQEAGWDLTQTWLLLSLCLFTLAGLCWLPVLWIQAQLKKNLQYCVQHQVQLPANHERLFRVWIILGWPAFLALALIFYLMVSKPQ